MIFTQPRYRREGLGPASGVVTNFVDSLWDVSSCQRNRWGGVRRKWGEQEDKRAGMGIDV